MTTNGLTFTAEAGRSILVNADISTNNGTITLTANDPGAQIANRDAGAGSIVMASGTTLNAGTQQIRLTTDTLVGGTPGDITVQNLTNSLGQILIDSQNAVTVSGSISTSAPITINANLDGTGAQRFTQTSSGSMTTSNTGSSAVQINVNTLAGGTGGAVLGKMTIGTSRSPSPLTGSGRTLTVATHTGGNTTGGVDQPNGGHAAERRRGDDHFDDAVG